MYVTCASCKCVLVEGFNLPLAHPENVEEKYGVAENGSCFSYSCLVVFVRKFIIFSSKRCGKS